MADILQITEDIPVDDSIYEYEYKEYNPIAGNMGDLNRGSIVIVIEAQDIYTHPAESFLIVEGQLKYDKVDIGDNKVNLINNAIMYLFSDIRYHLASHEIEVVQNPGYATTILGMLKYPDDFNKSQGLNQLWIPDNRILSVEDEDVLYNKDKIPLGDNKGFSQRSAYLSLSTTKGKFSFKIPLKHFLGFCEDYKKVIYGMQQRLTLTRTGDNDAIYTGKYAEENKYNDNTKIKDLYDEGDLKFSVHLEKIRWFMPHVIPSDAYRLQLNKIIERKEKIPVGYRMLQCDNAPVPANNNNFTWRLGVKSSPDIPRFIIIGFQTGRNNKQNKNPAVFDHCNVRNIYVTLNAKRYPDTDYEENFTENNYSRIYGDAATFRKKFYNMDELVSNPGIDPLNYKYFYPLFVFDVSKQSEKLKTSVSDIHIKASFNENIPANTIAYAVIISDRLFHFVSDGSKITNIV